MEYIGENKKVGEIKKEDFLFGTPFIHPTLIIKKEDILNVGGYPLYNRCEDYAMEMELYCNNYKGYIMNEILMKYRMDDNGYKKKKFKFRIIEIKTRLKYFSKMRIRWYNYIYVIKPLVVGIVPKKLLKKYHENKLKNRGK